MPTCPKCIQTFHRGADSSCPHCGFSLALVEKKIGKGKIEVRRVCDLSGALRHHDRMKLEVFLEKQERRIFPAVLAVYFPRMDEPFGLMRHSFWALNHFNVTQAGFGGRQDPVDPEWLFVLVIDIRNASACFTWGYQLDPYVDVNRINSSIMKASLILREGLLLQGVCKVMKDVTRQIVSRAHHVIAAPKKYGVVPIEEEESGKEGKR